ncbi:TerC family protein [Zavarzinella formosa]|uniref:TerC family protein n=1 Tax=Zavarzinella formosa TaxID=360055 RepID=UPI00030542EB|nr:TerC family protein [Zavarzinella formosa]
MLLRATLFAGFIALALMAADEPPKPFHVERVDGGAMDAALVTPAIRLKTPIGSQEIETTFIKRLTFATAEEPASVDVVELKDKETIRGKLLQPTLDFQIGDKTETIVVKELREIKAINTAKPGLVALIIGLFTLAAMEIVLGIDNIIFLAIVAEKLPEKQQPRARRLGLVAALGTRLLLLASLSFLLGLTKPVFTIPDLPFFHDLEAREVSLRDLILLVGGMFLIGKSVHEMHSKLEADEETEKKQATSNVSFGGVLIQIAILDIVFSLDSVITAVGMVEELWVMITAMIIAMLVMMLFAGTISEFVEKHPTIKVLALAFLILIGVMLVAESLGQHIDKGYIYFAMAFGVAVEMVNLRISRKQAAVKY